LRLPTPDGPERTVRQLRFVLSLVGGYSVGEALATGYVGGILTGGGVPRLGLGLLGATVVAIGLTRLHTMRWEESDIERRRRWAAFPAILASGSAALWTAANLGRYAPLWGWCAGGALAGYAMVVHAEDRRVGRQRVVPESWPVLVDALLRVCFAVAPGGVAFVACRWSALAAISSAIIVCGIAFAVVVSCMGEDHLLEDPPAHDRDRDW
jgi:hypothetical protein